MSDGEPAAREALSADRAAGPGAARYALLALAGLATLLVQVLASRGLGPGDYGALAALLGLIAALGVPLAALQTMLGALVVRRTERGTPVDLGPLLMRFVGSACLLALVASPAAWPAAAALHLSGPLPLLLVLLFLVPSAACTVLWAGRYGTRGLAGVAAPVATGSGVRLAVTALALAAGGGVCTVLAATVLGESTTAVALWLALRRSTDPVRGERLALPVRRAVGAVLTIAGLWSLTGIDLVCARRWLPPAEAGRYSAAAFLAKSALFAAQAAVVVLLGRLASADRRTAEQALRAGLAAASLAGAGVTAGLVLGGRRIIPMLLGPGYLVQPWLGLWLGLAATSLLLLALLLHYRVACGSWTGGVWIGVVAFPVLVQPMPDTACGIAAALALASALAVAAAWRGLPEPGLPDTTGTGTDRVRAGGSRTPAQPTPPGLQQPAELEISMVVPYYNPGPAFLAHIRELLGVLDAYGCSYEVLAVADGCTDRSDRALAELVHPRLRQIGYRDNAGKGAALRTGFQQARGHWIGFIDADGDIPAALVPDVLDAVRAGRMDAALGAKWLQPGTFPPRHGLPRRLCSYLYRTVTRVLFGLPLKDTQTGLKVFRREALARVLPLCRENRFVFDLELLALLHRHGHRRVVQVPVSFRPRTTSTVGPAAVALILRDTLRLRARLLRPARHSAVTDGFTPNPRPAPGGITTHELRPVPDSVS
ncbi:glycosyltransferase [Streptacidiphilus sp. N1-10]|uniref:Glycosyltransferase n=1 Tax=Streptacidiphilus jeojiensis TaxID=3229225 RepID=A0ABV6XH78_9ACTN